MTRPALCQRCGGDNSVVTNEFPLLRAKLSCPWAGPKAGKTLEYQLRHK